MTYDLTLLACRREDFENAEKAILLLREAMQFAGPRDVADLLGLYDWCLNRVRSGEFDVVIQSLLELRESWARFERQ
jgi:hypothetical protein